MRFLRERDRGSMNEKLAETIIERKNDLYTKYLLKVFIQTNSIE